MSRTGRYTIEQFLPQSNTLDPKLHAYFISVGKKVSASFGHTFNYVRFPIIDYANENRLMVCRRDGRPVGVMLSRLGESVFDPNVRILTQDLLYGEPGTRAAYLLMKDFIDFGRDNADHLITMLTPKTNVKRGTLERLGFSKLEELYRMRF